eukprot:9499214-Pyramimonas_sp.AAC.1
MPSVSVATRNCATRVRTVPTDAPVRDKCRGGTARKLSRTLLFRVNRDVSPTIVITEAPVRDGDGGEAVGGPASSRGRITSLRIVITSLQIVITSLQIVITSLPSVIALLRIVITSLRSVIASLRSVIASLPS